MYIKLTFYALSYVVTCCYFPPKPAYESNLLKEALKKDIEYFSNEAASDCLIIAGDFNMFNCDFLETDYGLVQLVKQYTHGKNILDKVFSSRPDAFSTYFDSSLIKTKHKAVIVLPSNENLNCHSLSHSKVKLFDLRSHNIHYLRFMVANADWSDCLECYNIQAVYDTFVHKVHDLINKCIPVKDVNMRKRDPPFVTPLVKVMLKKRLRLRQKPIYWL